MKKIFFLLAMVSFFLPFSSASAISIDGSSLDWAGIDFLVVDPIGDSSPGVPDTLGFKVAEDEEDVYLYYEFADSYVPVSFLYLDTDQDPLTGLPGVGMEYVVMFYYDYDGFKEVTLGDHRDGVSGDDFPGAIFAAFSEDGKFVEAMIEKDALSILTPDISGFNIKGVNDHTEWGNYQFQCQPVPEPCTILLLSSGLVPLMRMRKKFLKK